MYFYLCIDDSVKVIFKKLYTTFYQLKLQLTLYGKVAPFLTVISVRMGFALDDPHPCGPEKGPLYTWLVQGEWAALNIHLTIVPSSVQHVYLSMVYDGSCNVLPSFF